MKKLVYFHGFMSSSQSSKIGMLKKCLHDFEIVAPDIPVDPLLALPFLKELCQAEQPDVIIGKCMGGMYALQMHGFKRICINPAFFMSQFSKILKVGNVDFFNNRQDGATQFTITQDIISHFAEMEKHQFDNITNFDKNNTYGLFVENESVEMYMPVFQKYYTYCQYYSDVYRVDFSFINKIVAPLIHQITQNLSIHKDSEQTEAYEKP